MHDFDTFIFFKWIFKTFCAVLIVTNTWNIVMGVFEVAQSVVSQASGVIIGDTAIDVDMKNERFEVPGYYKERKGIGKCNHPINEARM